MKKTDSQYSKLYFNQNAGHSYDKAIDNRFDDFIFSLEKYYLRTVLTSIEGYDKSYLDFACGTGRIILFVTENFIFKEYVGLDSSKEMIEAAKNKVTKNGPSFIIGNIIEEPDVLDNSKFDIVTAFRLILNLEPDYRLPLFKTINSKMKKGGTLIINNHMNRYSILGLVAFFMHRVMRYPLKRDLEARREGRRTIINTMSNREVTKLLKESEFQVVRTYRFTFFPGHNNFILLPSKALYSIELFLSRIPLVNLFSKDHIYVCLKK